MASKPGILTDWPWTPLGSFKHIILVPWISESIYWFVVDKERCDLSRFSIFPFVIWRLVHNQLWISLSRYRTAKGTNRIVDKGIEFDQVDRERNWDDQILFNAILFYLGNRYIPGSSHMPFWRMDGLIITMLIHAGPVEFLYYWLHRALHHHFLYSRYHSHHHSSIVTEPITVDKSTDTLYENSLRRQEESPNVVHLTHLTTPHSIYHLRLGFAALASKPYSSTWYLWLLSPLTLWSMMLTWIYGHTFVVERNRFDKFVLQTWALPKYKIQYHLKWQKESINDLIEEAILEAEGKGARGEELNRYGGVYVQKHPQLKVKLVDGSSLATAAVLNTIPKGTTQVLLRGNLTKVAYAVAFALCQKGIQVAVLREDEYEKLKQSFGTKCEGNLVLSKTYSYKTWLVGDDLSEEEQSKATKGTVFIPFSQFPPKKLRKDCFYHTTPAMQAPMCLENVDSCENWLPRRVMSVWRIAGLVHALEGWEEHECGYTVSNIDKVWEATLKHGFQPLRLPTQSNS
ncbi:hypothetical protein COLO4_19320 [Corchorus olitorius]|uniref:Very-long-chain aldehyde decarbonylase CER1-like C-terminal domain-containing protein n=1 Tax=Corchorus olitorius TaxID=93759 RepID=A0A1R3J5R9_9ROSI|nr:hypothetical protein COLO4_19320 [Corchorus olitorius]